MRTRTEIISMLTNPGVIAVVRAQHPAQVPPLSEALLAAGVIAIEITLTTPNAFEAIREASRTFGDRALIGVGTVLTEEECRRALEAGAEFVVSPIARTELVTLAHASDRPIMLGAYTPTEVQRVHESGADFVKLFPADGLGPAYVRALRAPLPHLKIVPTGGVDASNVADWMKAGCPAVGAGSSLVAAKILSEANWPELTRRAHEFVTAAKSVKSPKLPAQ
jgi:2-dehydro-3-deoxyphosphogluconate aldolase/(4S)-4-hydroxy-2-oxoglutarate aldolase